MPIKSPLIKLIIVSMLITVCYSGFAQTVLRPQLDKFTGTWIYSNGNTFITFSLKKVSYYFRADNITEEILMGSHKFINNGILIEDNSSLFPQVGQAVKGSLFVYANNWNTDVNKAFGTVSNPIQHSYQTIELNFQPGTPAHHGVYNCRRS